MSDPKKPDLKTFLSDPKFQGDRELFGGFIEAYLSDKQKQVAETTQKGGIVEGVFGALFGEKKAPATKDEDRSIFDIF